MRCSLSGRAPELRGQEPGPAGSVALPAERLTRRRPFSSLPASVYLDTAVLGSLVGAVTALNLLWVSLDSRPPHWDMARHLGDSLFYRSIFDFSHPLRVL